MATKKGFNYVEPEDYIPKDIYEKHFGKDKPAKSTKATKSAPKKTTKK